MPTTRLSLAPLLLLAACLPAAASAPKVHTVVLGASRRVPYTPPEATPENKSEDSTTLRVRPLIVDERQKEWTVGDLHDVTDRSFVIRRALHINDSLPGEAPRWTWQPGPWLMVDRVTGHITALHLPAYDAQLSEVVWFRDYAAYCGLTTTKTGGLVAVVAQLGARRPVVERVLAPWPQPEPQHPVCAAAHWQRMPIRVTLAPTAMRPLTFDVVGTTSLIEEGDSTEE